METSHSTDFQKPIHIRFSLVCPSLWAVIAEKQHFGPFWAPKKGFCRRRGLLFLYHGMKMTPKYHN